MTKIDEICIYTKNMYKKTISIDIKWYKKT